MHFKFSVLLSRANEKKITNVQGVLNRYNKRKKKTNPIKRVISLLP